VTVDEIEAIPGRRSILVTAGNVVRDRVGTALEPYDDGRALLAGFLIGDTSRMADSDLEAMRLSGLSHLVAVSGSNIALFLGLLAIAAGPLALGPRRRAVVGLLGLPIYAVATRFEPSVMRASAMAGLALMGRLVGVVLEAWQLLALAVTVLLVLDPSLATSPGFGLSVAATGGVLIGGRWPVRSGRTGRALAVTTAAQLAVSPLLLVFFGSIPLLSPAVNLVAGPMVAIATVVGAVGVSVAPPLTGVGAWVAQLVLALARGASTWPQLEPLQFAGLVLVLVTAWRWPRVRPWLAVVGAVLTVVWVAGLGAGLPRSGVVVLDVGQGDAILISGGEGQTALVDGGPDPVILIHALRRYGVTALDLVVMTHGDADHAGGLIGLPGRYPIDELWYASDPHQTPTSSVLLGAAERWGIPIRVPTVGETLTLGSLVVEVEGPLRRYASPNDQSLVLEVRGPMRSILLSGDIETHAQAELAHIHADILKVPHHGAGTSDARWLAGVGAEVAVISVGPNDFGHPVDWVLDTLEESGAVILRTDEEGDVTFDLGGP
jgi:competence protein ComEC